MNKFLIGAVILVALAAAIIWSRSEDPSPSATVVETPTEADLRSAKDSPSAPEEASEATDTTPRMNNDPSQAFWSKEQFEELAPEARLVASPSAAIRDWKKFQGYPSEDLVTGSASDNDLEKRALENCDRSASSSLTERMRRSGDPRWLARAREHYADSIFHIELLFLEQAERPFATGNELISWAATAASLGDPNFLTVVGGFPYRRHIESLDHQQLMYAVSEGLAYVDNVQRSLEALDNPMLKAACSLASKPRPYFPWDHLATDREKVLLPSN